MRCYGQISQFLVIVCQFPVLFGIFLALFFSPLSLFFIAKKMTTIGAVEQDFLTFCSDGNVVLVQTCLNHPNIRTGINQIRDSNGISPMHKAAENGHASVLQLLAQVVTSQGRRLVDWEIPTKNDGWTPLHLSAGHGHLTAVQCLIQYGANVHVCDKYGRTPLHRASYKGHLSIIECLHLHGGASIHCADRDGDTPLHDAYHGGHLDVVQYLVENGASNKIYNLGGYDAFTHLQ